MIRLVSFFISLLVPAGESIPALIILSETHHGTMMCLLAEHSVEFNAEWDTSRSSPDDSLILYSVLLVVGLWWACLLFVLLFCDKSFMAQSDNDISVARSCLCLWLCGIRLQRYKMIWEQSAYFVSVQVIRSYIVSVSDARMSIS